MSEDNGAPTRFQSVDNMGRECLFLKARQFYSLQHFHFGQASLATN